MLDGRRKSIQPITERLPDGNMQALQQFVDQSPWEYTPVQRRLATKVSEAITPDAWVIDGSGLPKAGTESVGRPTSGAAPWASRRCARAR
ncbi:transposase [Nocardiopsis sp. NPDC006198]|uniref:transposase n=1 Tax=Nocardiopsis sp. NPDC006198 TaxID=3154472 RepID=UPI0033AA1028